MDLLSKSDCRERAIYWALKADALGGISDGKKHSGEASSHVWAAPSGMAATAQMWATLALSATNS